MRSFRTTDKRVGGGHLYAEVVTYLQTDVAPRLFGVSPGDDTEGVFAAAAALTDMAGWMAHDAGRSQTAQQHFARALDLARLSGDRQLGAHILASLSHLAHHRRLPDHAIHYARRGRAALGRGPRQPEIEARLLAIQARGYSALGGWARSW